MTKFTDTVRIAYNWADRNGVGPVLHYGSRQWETGEDEDEALSQACSGLRSPQNSIQRLVDKDYPLRDILSPGPNKSKLPPNVLSTAVMLFAIEIAAGLIWMWLR